MNNAHQLNRILFYIPHFYIGGVSKVFINLITELSKLNIKIFIVIGDSDRQLEMNLSKIKSIETIRLDIKKTSKSLAAIKSLLRLIDPDIAIGVQSHASWILSIAAVLSFFEGKIISWEHTTPSRALNNCNKLKKFFYRAFSKICSIRINSYVCVSNGVASDIQNFLKINSKKIAKISSPIFDDKIPKKVSSKHNNNCIKFLTVGRLSTEKGLTDLLEAVSRLPKNRSWHLTIVGSGPEEANLKKFVKEKNLSEYVLFAGHQNSVENWYLTSDVFVLTSYYEGLPTVLVESSHYGLPIISTNCESGPSEIIKNGKNGVLVPVGDINKIENALIEMIYHNKKYHNSSEYVAEYEITYSANEFLKHFKSLNCL